MKTNMSMNKKPTYDTKISYQMLRDKNLLSGSKILYSEIEVLSQETGYCTVANDYLAYLYDVGESTIRRWISNLQENGYINVEFLRTKKTWSRRIYLTSKTSTLTHMI